MYEEENRDRLRESVVKAEEYFKMREVVQLGFTNESTLIAIIQLS